MIIHYSSQEACLSFKSFERITVPPIVVIIISLFLRIYIYTVRLVE